MPRVVKRYANRKLYDTTTSRYVALDDIAEMVRGGEEVEVTDNETGADLTAVTLAQIILEDERRKKNLLSLPLLRQIVRYGDKLAGATNRGIEALGEMRERAERKVSEIVSEGPNLLDDVLSTSRQRIDELQRRIDDGLKQSMGRLRNAPGIGVEVDRLDARLKELEARIRHLLARQNGGPANEERPAAKSGGGPSDLGRVDES
jgi:polyhydroxyalkanoate synthesis repressor PhaR